MLPPGLDEAAAHSLVTAMVRSRLLDQAARDLRAAGLGHYTIASAGHEHMAVIGQQLHRTDPCLLHYRDGALVMAKSPTHPDRSHDPVAATIASLTADRDEPASGGRHKVWGDPATWIIPQTSTIGSHPPKAVGLAAMLARATRARTSPPTTSPPPHSSSAGSSSADSLPPLADDAIVVCTFGDASANHATTLSALTAARWAQRHGNPVPILFVVEDNGRGISVPTPSRWIEDSLASLPGLAWLDADGPVDQAWATVGRALDIVRTQRRPVVLRMATVRFGGHAGSDVETSYRSATAIRADLDRDPLPAAIIRLAALGALDWAWATSMFVRERDHVAELVARAAPQPLADPSAVQAPLAPHSPDAVRDAAAATVAAGATAMPDRTRRLTLAAGITAGLAEQLEGRPTTIVFGEDVAVKGGVYGVTRGLHTRFGSARVFDTLLDETTILGTAQGAALAGLVPIPEVQYLAYLHNALDQLRGEAASTSFFSNGAFTTGMVVRVAGLADQRGFGGHFHNDNSIGALRDIPGLRLAVPTTAAEAVGILRAATAMAWVDGSVTVVLEPIALYHERDLHEPDDGAWLTSWPEDGHVVLPGEVVVHEPSQEANGPLVQVVTWGNGVRMARRVARRVAARARVRVVAMPWVVPLPLVALRGVLSREGPILVVDEARASGGIADAVVAALHAWQRDVLVDAVTSADSFIPTGPAAATVLLQEQDIEAGIDALAARWASGHRARGGGAHRRIAGVADGLRSAVAAWRRGMGGPPTPTSSDRDGRPPARQGADTPH